MTTGEIPLPPDGIQPPQLNSGADVAWARRRAWLVTALFLIPFALVVRRAYHLQIESAGPLQQLAVQQHFQNANFAPRRGTIYDRLRQPLAISVDVESVFANPHMIHDLDQTAHQLATLLNSDPRELRRLLRSEHYFVWLKRRVSEKVAAQVRKLAIRGIFLQSESQRFYPNRLVASTVMGFSSVDGRGLEGVEAGWDELLRGRNVKVPALRDALGKPLLAQGITREWSAGHDLVLSLSKGLQYETEQALAGLSDQVTPHTGWATAVVMNPQSGDILAMASFPSFDPNRFSTANASNWRNRALTDAFEPGSTMKVFSMAAALSAGAISLHDTIDCERGSWRLSGHVIHDVKPYGRLTVTEVLAKSSNIGMSKIALRVGKDQLHQTFKNFGFGTKTGIDLPGERGGTLRAPGEWSTVGLANAAFGQGLTTTVVQLARALSVIGNGGFLVRPRIVLRVLDPRGNQVEEFPPQRERVMSSELTAQVMKMMQAVTEAGGTGTSAALPGFSVAGKTGTAQKVDPRTGKYSPDKWVSSFMGLVPSSDPRLAIVVVVNEPLGARYHGGEVAGPVFKRIAEAAIRHYGVDPDAQTPTPSKSALAPALPRKDDTSDETPDSEDLKSTPIGRVPDFTGMSMAEVISAARKVGVPLEMRGSGRAVAQSVSPGEHRHGRVCIVSFEPPG